MKDRLLFCSIAVGILVASAGCAHPVITGGDVAFDVYVARDSELTLLATRWADREFEAAREAAIRRSTPASRYVVVPRYTGPDDPLVFPAQLATAKSDVISYPKRLQFATWEGREHLPWDTHPKGRPFLEAWVFVEGCWPVFMTESITTHGFLMTGEIRTRWGGWKEVPSSLEGEATVICFPASRPWDREVAAAAGCLEFDYYFREYSKIPALVGADETLTALSEVPCSFVESVDQSKGLTDADRLMVFRQVLRLYEHTKPYWASAKKTYAGMTYREVHDSNTRLLRKRIKALEAKAASSPSGG